MAVPISSSNAELFLAKGRMQRISIRNRAIKIYCYAHNCTSTAENLNVSLAELTCFFLEGYYCLQPIPKGSYEESGWNPPLPLLAFLEEALK